MTVRRATPADVDAVRTVARESWETDYPSILSRESVESGVDEWYDPDRVRAALGADDELLRVAERDGAVVGFAHGLVDGEGGSGHVLRLYVRPDARGEGVGGRLLERVRDELFDRGVGRIHAMVLADNDPGNEFYRSFGFELVERAETTIGGESYPENRYVLERP
ncbi:GNAT family N-acetyltransferase [Halobaculum sp. EA56]|uniref:GNAT family N-acetyltransferase n=1 Tax=Halobaculum sp. EA56 TaxID=3421648 RepID=UPI003EBA0636